MEHAVLNKGLVELVAGDVETAAADLTK